MSSESSSDYSSGNDSDSDSESNATKEDSDKESEECEDELSNLITKRKQFEHNVPETIITDTLVTSCSFSPTENIIVAGLVTGDIRLYSYEDNKTFERGSIESHLDSCRCLQFSSDGKYLYSASKDKSLVITDVERKDMIRFKDHAHEHPIHEMCVISENIICTGDDNGIVKTWDMRSSILPVCQNNKDDILDYISSFTYKEDGKYLYCTSGDGLLTIYDLRKLTIHSQSEHKASDMTCSALTDRESRLVCGSLLGDMQFYTLSNASDCMGKYSPLKKQSLNCILSVTNNIVITGWEDKTIRAFHLFPNKQIGIVGQHKFPVEGFDVSMDGSIIASFSSDYTVKFWNIKYLEEYDVVQAGKIDKNKQNLPSSEMDNRGDFFSDLF